MPFGVGTPLFGVGTLLVGVAPLQAEPLHVTYREQAGSLIGRALVSDNAYRRLGELCDRFGHRLSGSATLHLSTPLLDLQGAEIEVRAPGDPVLDNNAWSGPLLPLQIPWPIPDIPPGG